MSSKGSSRRRTARPARSVPRRSRLATATERRLRALRAREASKAEHAVLVASCRFRIPETNWVGPFTRRHPTLRIEYLSITEIDRDTSVADCWISGRVPGAWTQELSEIDQIHRVEALAQVGGGCVYRITFENPPIVYLYRGLGIPLPLPIWAQAGYVRWEIVARLPEYRRLIEFGRALDPNFRLVAVRRGPILGHLPSLSPVQQKVLATAMAAGYFEVPRRVSLGELARRLRRSRTALSETIALIEEKLLESGFQGTAFRATGTA